MRPYRISSRDASRAFSVRHPPCHYCFRSPERAALGRVIRKIHRPHDIVQMRIYMVDLQSDGLEIVMSQLVRFLEGAQPSLASIGVAALASPVLKVEVEMVVQVPA